MSCNKIDHENGTRMYTGSKNAFENQQKQFALPGSHNKNNLIHPQGYAYTASNMVLFGLYFADEHNYKLYWGIELNHIIKPARVKLQPVLPIVYTLQYILYIYQKHLPKKPKQDKH